MLWYWTKAYSSLERNTRITWIISELIKIGQMSAGAVCHEAHYLFEKFEDIYPFFTFSYRTKESIKQRENPNLMKISDEQCQAGPAGQPIAGRLDGVNFRFLFPVIFAIFFHQVLHLLGVAILVITLVGFNKYYSTLPSDEGLFYFMNRLH